MNNLELNFRILFKFRCSDCVFYLQLHPSSYLVHEKYPKMIKHFDQWICFSSLRESVASCVLKLVGQKDLLSIIGAEKRDYNNSGFSCFEQQLHDLIVHPGNRGSLKNSETTV